MRAVVIPEFGGPEVLKVAEVDAPTAGPGQVRVTVRSAGVNPLDWKIRSGFAPFPIELPFIPGLEASGVIDQVGEGVTGYAIGDEVFGLAQAAIAEHAVLSVYAHKPATMSWNLAGTLPIAAETALRTLTLLGVKDGDTLLIGSAGGAVGSIATQMAVQRGATVIGTASAADQEFVRSLGATPTLYGEGLIERVRELAPQGIDLALDAGGHGALPDMIELTGSADNVLTIADPAAFGIGVRFSAGGPEEDRPEAIEQVAEQFTKNPPIFRVGAELPIEKIAEAHEISFAGGSSGKPVIAVSK